MHVDLVLVMIICDLSVALILDRRLHVWSKDYFRGVDFALFLTIMDLLLIYVCETVSLRRWQLLGYDCTGWSLLIVAVSYVET